MKTKIILHLALILAGLISTNGIYAQDYRVLQPEKTTLYKNSNGMMLGMRIDSVKVEGTDTAFYLLKNLQQVGYECYHLDGPSWLGEKVTIKPNGESVFYNLNHESILIKTQAAINEAWICYSSPELSFRATINSNTEADILGFTDSVKTISLQAINANGQTISHYINSLNIVLSKNYGISKALNFLEFPNIQYSFVLYGIREMSLCGMDNPQAGIQNLLWKEVHDHNPGDELHTLTIESYFGYSRTEETIQKLLSKTINPDTIINVWKVETKLTISSFGNTTISSSSDTIERIITQNTNFDQLPGVTCYYSDYYNISTLHEVELGIMKAMGQYFGGITNPYWIDTCYITTIDGGSVTSLKYIKGLSGPYYNNVDFINQHSRELVYYKKDGLEWGTPLEFTVNSNLQPIEANTGLVSVYPNPLTEGIVNIGFNRELGKVRLLVTDISGLKLAEYTLTGKNNTIDLQHLKKGNYLLRFSTENQVITKKLVKI